MATIGKMLLWLSVVAFFALMTYLKATDGVGILYYIWRDGITVTTVFSIGVGIAVAYVIYHIRAKRQK